MAKDRDIYSANMRERRFTESCGNLVRKKKAYGYKN
jgi:hypothetical protein